MELEIVRYTKKPEWEGLKLPMAMESSSGPGFTELERIRSTMLALSKEPRAALDEYAEDLADLAENLAAILAGVQNMKEE